MVVGIPLPASPENGCRDCRQREVTVVYRPYRRISNNDGEFRVQGRIVLLVNSAGVEPRAGGRAPIEACYTDAQTLIPITARVNSRPVGGLVEVINPVNTQNAHDAFERDPRRFASVSSRCPGASFLRSAVDVGFFTEDGAFTVLYRSGSLFSGFWRPLEFIVTETRAETFRCEKQEGRETMSFQLGGVCVLTAGLIFDSISLRVTDNPSALTAFRVFDSFAPSITFPGGDIPSPVELGEFPIGEINSDQGCPPPEWDLVCGLVDCRECPPETACECESDDGSLCCYGADGSLLDTISSEDRC